jgi:hypothetical protein
MKRFITLLLFIFSLILTVVSALAWINNIFVVKMWYEDLNSPHNIKLLSPVEKTYSGIITSLDWAAVDLSTISTFIPFFGLILISYGFWRILMGNKNFSEDFPFFSSYDRISVSLGLIGTLWGIIIIGYYPIESIKMSVLMLCLHTALFSTLVAVAWVFIVVLMIIKPFMHWWSRIVAGEHDSLAGEDLFSVLQNLQSAAAGAGSELSVNHKKLKEFNHELEQGKTNLTLMSSELANCLTNINNMVNETMKETAAIRADRESQSKLIERTVATIDKINVTHNDIVMRLKTIETENDEFKLKNKTLITENNELALQTAESQVVAEKAEETLSKIKKAMN